jgi:hypothetical protein
MVDRKRNKVLVVRMLDAEVTMLGELAEREGLTVSEWVRNVIRREHLLVFSPKPKAKRKR